MSNQQLAIELHKPIIRQIKKRKVYSSFKDNIWRVYLADMQLISKCKNELDFYYVLLIFFSKYPWVVPLKYQKGITIVNAFKIILDSSKRKPNKIWGDQSSELYNNSF